MAVSVTIKRLYLRFFELYFHIEYQKKKVSDHKFSKINGDQANISLLTSHNLSNTKTRKRIYWRHAKPIRHDAKTRFVF